MSRLLAEPGLTSGYEIRAVAAPVAMSKRWTAVGSGSSGVGFRVDVMGWARIGAGAATPGPPPAGQPRFSPASPIAPGAREAAPIPIAAGTPARPNTAGQMLWLDSTPGRGGVGED